MAKKKRDPILNAVRSIEHKLKRKESGEERVTVYCGLCNENLWKIKVEALRSKVIRHTDLEPQSDEFEVKRNVVPLDCPFCGSGVFDPAYRGGYEFLTREKDKVPKRGSPSRIRIQLPGFYDRRNQLQGFRESIFGTPGKRTVKK